MLRMVKQKQHTAVKPHVRKNDVVEILAGKDAGKQGKVLRVLPAKGTAVVERVNFIKRHTRPNPQKNIQGGVVEREAPVHLSNVRVICPSCGEPTRIGRKSGEEGNVRVCRHCAAEI